MVKKANKKILKYVVWEGSYMSSICLILFFYPFTVELKSAFDSNSLSKGEKDVKNHQQDYAKMSKNMSVWKSRMYEKNLGFVCLFQTPNPPLTPIFNLDSHKFCF